MFFETVSAYMPNSIRHGYLLKNIRKPLVERAFPPKPTHTRRVTLACSATRPYGWRSVRESGPPYILMY